MVRTRDRDNSIIRYGEPWCGVSTSMYG